MLIDRDEIDKALKTKEAWASFVEKEDRPFSELDFSKIHLDDYDFSGLDFESCDFSDSSFKNCNFSRSNLYGSNWSSSKIHGSSFLGSMLTGANFYDSEIENCDFSGAELSNIGVDETSVQNCDFSRSRGVSQFILDQIVGNTTTSIPQFLDYPEHWLLTNEQREQFEWKRKLSSFRGDDVILCVFDGKRLYEKDFASSTRDELKQSLDHIQNQVKYAIKDKLFHNENPVIFRALLDYYQLITSEAGVDDSGNVKPRWPRKVYELEEIKIGLQGNNLISLYESCKSEMGDAFPEKISSLEHILNTHLMISANLPRWKSFLHSTTDAAIGDKEIKEIEKYSEPIIQILEEEVDVVDESIPHSIRVIRKFIEQPLEIAKLGGYGIIRCVESIFSSLFSFSKRFLGESSDEVINFAPKVTVKLLVTGLLAAGAAQMFSMFPHLKTWLDGGLAVLRSIGIIS